MNDTTRGYSMADISGKQVTHRVAVASGRITVGVEAFDLLRSKALPKGDALALAEFAGIQAAKQTPSLIPLCHPIALNRVAIYPRLREDAHAVDVYAVHNALTARSRTSPTSAWIANNTILNIIRQMSADAAGSNFWANLGDSTPSQLLGMPVYEASAMTAVVTTGSSILLAGAFEDYAIVDRLGTTVVAHQVVVGGSARQQGADRNSVGRNRAVA